MKKSKEQMIELIAELKTTKSYTNRMLITLLMNDYGYKLSTAYQYIKLASELIGKNYVDINDIEMNEAVGQLKEILNYAFENKNFKLWFEVRKELNKVLGLESTKKIDITSGGKSINLKDMFGFEDEN